MTHPQCACGCGQPTNIITISEPRWGRVKGEYSKYVKNHHTVRLEPNPELIEVDTNTNCHNWLGGTFLDTGYGRVVIQRETWLVHRWFYTQRFGEIPDDLDLDHLCRNIVCCNPDHLEAVTRAVNTQRGLLCKLTPADIVLIRSLKGIKTAKELSLTYGVTQHSIHNVWHRRTWNNI